MRSKIDPETMKIQAPGSVLESSGDPLGGLSVSGALLEISGAIRWRFLMKVGRSWAQDGRKMGQVGSKLRPRWAMMAPRWPSWVQFGSFLGGPGTTCGHFFRDLCKNGRSVKTNNTSSLLVVFWGRGLLWRVLEAVLGGFWELF